jgi:hypothetical protein
VTDPLNPSHDEPAEGPRDADYSSSSGAETAKDAGDDAAANASAKATEVLGQIRVAVDDLAVKAAPTVREFSAKAADLVAVAADKAAPIAHKAGEVTADASSKLAVKSRSWAADIRVQVIGSDKGGAADVADAAKDAAQDAAKNEPPL